MEYIGGKVARPISTAIGAFEASVVLFRTAVREEMELLSQTSAYAQHMEAETLSTAQLREIICRDLRSAESGRAAYSASSETYSADVQKASRARLVQPFISKARSEISFSISSRSIPASESLSRMFAIRDSHRRISLGRCSIRMLPFALL